MPAGDWDPTKMEGMPHGHFGHHEHEGHGEHHGEHHCGCGCDNEEEKIPTVENVEEKETVESAAPKPEDNKPEEPKPTEEKKPEEKAA